MAAFNRASSSSPSTTGGIADDTLFVAVTRDFNDTKSVLLWALENRHSSGICLIHIHQPDKRIPTPLGKIPINLANKHQIEAHRVTEREKLSKKLEMHLQFCRQHGVVAAKIYVEMDSVQEGIVKLVADQKIKKLVMGAAADKRFTKGMIEILSEKAKYVQQHSSSYCHIWFICKKLLIHTKEAPEKSARFEAIERLRAAPSYEIGGFIRTLSCSTYCSSLSGPSAPELSFSDGKKEIDAWLLTQEPCDLYPPSFKTTEAESLYLEEPEKALNESYEVLEELEMALDRISSFESRIEKYNLMVEQLERRLQSATKTVEKYKKERDEMQVERDNAIKEVEEAKKQSSSVNFPMIKSELPFQDIENATNRFDRSLKVREDAYGITYKGSFSIQLAVKVPHHEQAPYEFQQEVEIMKKLKHPNIVNLVAICPDSQALIYEHFGNPNLEDQLNFKAENPPLKCQTRLQIASELCNVLTFLHSREPQPIIHGDLRAVNIHLDSKLNCKLNDFRTSIEVLNGTFSLENRAVGYADIDPEYFATEELTTRSDVYSFGIVLLRLLTGKPATKLVREVQKALELDEVSGLVDPLAEWPLEQAKLLADLALRCCEMSRHRRPDLDPDVWKAMESIN